MSMKEMAAMAGAGARAGDEGSGKQRVLVLGARGYVGARLVRRLAAGGFEPVAVSRGGGGDGVEWHRFDAGDGAALAAALKDVGAVVNCVAGSASDMVRVARVLQACLMAMALPPRLIHFSSMAVYGAGTGSIAEDHALDASISAYAQAKVEC